MTRLKRVLCFFQGHNLIGVHLPEGWSRQICRTCGDDVVSWRRGGSTQWKRRV